MLIGCREGGVDRRRGRQASVRYHRSREIPGGRDPCGICRRVVAAATTAPTATRRQVHVAGGRSPRRTEARRVSLLLNAAARMAQDRKGGPLRKKQLNRGRRRSRRYCEHEHAQHQRECRAVRDPLPRTHQSPSLSPTGRTEHGRATRDRRLLLGHIRATRNQEPPQAMNICQLLTSTPTTRRDAPNRASKNSRLGNPARIYRHISIRSSPAAGWFRELGEVVAGTTPGLWVLGRRARLRYPIRRG